MSIHLCLCLYLYKLRHMYTKILKIFAYPSLRSSFCTCTTNRFSMSYPLKLSASRNSCLASCEYCYKKKTNYKIHIQGYKVNQLIWSFCLQIKIILNAMQTKNMYCFVFNCMHNLRPCCTAKAASPARSERTRKHDGSHRPIRARHAAQCNCDTPSRRPDTA